MLAVMHRPVSVFDPFRDYPKDHYTLSAPDRKWDLLIVRVGISFCSSQSGW